MAAGMTKCPDCSAEYKAEAPVYDSRPEALDGEGNPTRLYDSCLNEQLDRDEEEC